jgi:hypothetical protein
MEKAFLDLIKRQSESEDLIARFCTPRLISDSLTKTLNASSISGFLGTEQSRIAAASLVTIAEKERQSISNFLKITNPLPSIYINEAKKLGESFKAHENLALKVSKQFESLRTFDYLNKIKFDALKAFDVRSNLKSYFVEDAIKRLSPVVPSNFFASQSTALTHFQELSKVFNTRNLFSERITRQLRDSLGDWRGQISVPSSAQTLYVSQGFDRGLTDFPTEVFYEVVSEAGLTEATSDIELFGPVINDINDEFLQQEERNTKCYARIYKLEQRFREFIERSMSQRFGSGWFKQLPNGVKVALQEVLEKKNNAGEKRTLIQCTDFSHYLQIIDNGKLWNEVFQPLFKTTRKADVIESLNRLKPVRDTAMHCNPVSHEDWVMLYYETGRLLSVFTRAY